MFRRHFQIFLPLFILFSSLALTFSLRERMLMLAEDRLATEFAFRSEEVNEHIKARMNAYRDILASTQGLFSATPTSEKVFSDYTQKLKLDERYPGVQALAYSAYLPLESQNHTGSKQSSVKYVFPKAGSNLHALGYDMLSEESRHEAMMRAAESGDVALSSKVKLVNGQLGFLMFLPVYKSTSMPPTVQERKAQLKGWVFAPFRANDFFDGVLGKSSLDIEIFDGVESPSQVLFDSDDLPREYKMHRDQIKYSTTHELDIYGHRWIVRSYSLPPFEAKLDRYPANILWVVGCALSLILAFATWILMTSRAHALSLVQAKTRELSQMNQISKWIHMIDRVLSDSTTYESAIESLLTCLSSETSWQVVSYWEPTSNTNHLRMVNIRSGSPERHFPFIEFTSQLTLAPGEGLPGRVQVTEQVTWIPEIQKVENFPRKQVATACRLKSGLAIPVKFSNSLVGILELFSEDVIHPLPSVTKDLEAIGLRIGQKLENLKLAESLRVEQFRLQQFTSAVNASAIVSITDAKGRITFVNDKFCEISGYTRDELMGQDHRIMKSGLESKSFFSGMWNTVLNGQTWAGEIRNRKKMASYLRWHLSLVHF